MKDMKSFLPSGPGELVPRCEKILEASPKWLTERHRNALRSYMEAVEYEQPQSDERTEGGRYP